jgi:hypothetical protein
MAAVGRPRRRSSTLGTERSATISRANRVPRKVSTVTPRTRAMSSENSSTRRERGGRAPTKQVRLDAQARAMHVVEPLPDTKGPLAGGELAGLGGFFVWVPRSPGDSRAERRKGGMGWREAPDQVRICF